MADRPIPFSAPMVLALLAGTKTQTRRPAKFTANGHVKEPGGHRRWHPADPQAALACPYGQPGDRLWVREAWRALAAFNRLPPRDIMAGPVWYEAQDDVPFHPTAYGKYRPPMFMPRWASRITLEVTGVRVERLQAISRGDAMAEGCPFANMASGPDPRQWYAKLWDEINGPGSWDANPWVWVVGFRRVEQSNG